MKLKHFEKLLNKFDEAAQRHGWEQDHGSPDAAWKAWQVYIETRDALRNYVARKIFKTVVNKPKETK